MTQALYIIATEKCDYKTQPFTFTLHTYMYGQLCFCGSPIENCIFHFLIFDLSPLFVLHVCVTQYTAHLVQRGSPAKSTLLFFDNMDCHIFMHLRT